MMLFLLISFNDQFHTHDPFCRSISLLWYEERQKKKNLFRSISIVAKKHGSTTIMALLFIYLFFPPLSGKAL